MPGEKEEDGIGRSEREPDGRHRRPTGSRQKADSRREGTKTRKASLHNRGYETNRVARAMAEEVAIRDGDDGPYSLPFSPDSSSRGYTLCV